MSSLAPRRLPALFIVAATLATTAGVGPSIPVASAGEWPAPTVTLPPDGLRGHALWDSYFDLAPFGYEEQEYFVSGSALDGAGETADYTTRILVTRPSDPASFNGTVLLDWVNVTAQFENAVDTMLTRPMLMREGFAFVHVSAQEAGVCCIPLTPKTWDPVRYAALDHPGDAWAFDMFTQVAAAFTAPSQEPGSLDPMGPLAGRVERVLAAGQSQSANQLTGYIRDWLPAHPEAIGLIDGVLVHGNVPGSKSFAVGAPVPVLQLLSDFEAVDDGVVPGSIDPNHRLWEVAGTAHADFFIGYQSVFGHGPRVMADQPKQSEAQYRELLDKAGNYGEQLDPLLATCFIGGTTMPMRYAASAALHHLDAWVAGRSHPPNGPRFEFASGALAKDQHSNALGGIRLPPIDVPVATYASTTCQLAGITVPFTDLQIQQLHGSHGDYFEAMASRADAAVASGWLLPDDAVDLMRRACAASVRFPAPPGCRAYVPPAFHQPLPDPPAPPSSPGGDATPVPGGDRTALPATGATGTPGLGLVGVAVALAGLVSARRVHAKRHPASDRVPLRL